MMEPVRVVPRRIWSEGSPSVGSRSIPEETAAALTYNGGTYAVMMTTPQDLQDFAVGFSLSEGIISSHADIDSLNIVHLDDGVELRMWLSRPKADRLRERRRHIAGPTGCGLCGIESIAEAMRPAAVVGHGRASVMVSISAPTALAVRMADATGITLAAIARADGFEVFTHPRRISYGAIAVKTRSSEAISMPAFRRSARCESLS